MQGKTNKLVTMDCVIVGEWLIKASQYNGTILVIMFNEHNGSVAMYYLKDIKEVNLFIEYIIEKGGYND